MTSCGSFLGIPVEHGVDELNGVGARVGDELAQVHARALVPLEVDLGGERDALGPVVLGGRAEHVAYLEELIDLAAARKERPQRVALGRYASHRPYVDRRVVVRRAQEDLRAAIPARRHVVGVGRTRANLARQPEVGDLDELGAVAQQVLGLEVAMKEAVLVHVGEALHHLEDDVAHGRLREQVVASLHQLVQVLVHELEYHVQIVVLTYDLLEAHDIRMAYFLQ